MQSLTKGILVRRRVLLAAALALTVVAGAALGFRWVTTSTPVSRHRAVEQFRQSRDEQPPPSSASSAHVKKSSGRASPTALPRPDDRATQEPDNVSSRLPGSPFAPEPGVYTWRTQGFEEAMGLRRSFPSRSQRIVTAKSARDFAYEHVYSEEHREWFEVSASNGRADVPHIRTYVAFGPFDAEVNVDFVPPMLFASVPFAVGRTWKGRWEGDTFGDYTARVFERRKFVVDGTDVEAWGIELLIRMHGEVESEQRLKVWIDPKHRTTVREEYVVTGRLRGKPGTYHGEWSISLLSLDPQR